MRKCDRRPIVLVCDLESAAAFLGQSCGDVLLLDELTVGCEDGKEPTGVALMYSKVLSLSPRCTVLMSATVPSFDEMPHLCRLFEQRNGVDALYETAASERLSIGVEARDAEGVQWLPHHFLGGEAAASAVAEDGHLARFYGPRGLMRLLGDAGLDADEALAESDLFSHDAIRSAARRILTANAGRLHPSGAAPAGRERPSDSAGMATTQAYRYAGFTLVVSAGGSEAFFAEAMPELLEKVPAVRRLMTKAKKAVPERRQKPDSDDEPAWTADTPPPPPKVRWPMEAVINSAKHVGIYAPEAVFDKRNFKKELVLPDAIAETSAEAIVESALSGVLLIDSPWSDQAFELCALALADAACPSFVVADTSFVYGVNLPVDRVLVLLPDKVLGEDELRQLCGRAGRTGKATRAEVVFQDPALLVTSLSPLRSRLRGHAPLDRLLAADN